MLQIKLSHWRILIFCWIVLIIGAESAPAIAIRIKPAKSSVIVELTGLEPKVIEKLVRQKPTFEEWQELVGFYVGKPGDSRETQLPMGGTYRIEDQTVCFDPRYPLLAKVRYRAVISPKLLVPLEQQKPREIEILLPKEKAKPVTRLEGVFPSSDRLPENQLKFYLYFSAPMSRGEAYRRIQLLDDQGKTVLQPFLELDEEFWDPSGTRFTLFFDPGRIKRGLKPREDIGPVLVEGKRYTLVIDHRWADSQGQPLHETIRKSFAVLAPEDRLPDVKEWKLEAPKPGTTMPLVVRFPRALDHALLQRLLWIEMGKERIQGKIELTHQELQWEFTPKDRWKAGSYHLMVDRRLEDLAGNSIGKAFEVDVFRPVQKEITSSVVPIPFVVR